jgi:hypothetical protein
VGLKKINVKNSVLSAALAGLVLAGCGESTKLLGKSLPDETVVVDGPSLELPPEFSLRPPRDAQDYESVLRAQKGVEAQALITGVSASEVVVSGTAAGEVPNTEAWLLNKASEQTGAIQPDIREQLKIDAAGKAEATDSEAKRKQGLFGRWFGSASDE